ncbi:hypothetical protein HDU91_000201 [Kappamyces sp. JEL0680]|nr:hypothetical protein HDU91_000201 [Kappamyces sp. JEL0680]
MSDDPGQQNTEPPFQKEPPRKVVIIGSGVTGLALLLALNQVAEEANIYPLLYTRDTTFTESKSECWNLWKTGIEAALELGLGKRLGKISWPIVKLKSVEMGFDASGDAAASSPSSAGPAGILVDWPPVASPSKTTIAETDYLPPMIGLRKVDLVRTLLTALSGRGDLVYDTVYAVKPANNSSSAVDPPVGVEADLARGDWFEDEGFRDLLPQIKFGHELESFVISSEYGCDGVDSTVRNLLFNDRISPAHTNQLVLHGLTPLNAPPIDAPTQLPDGRTVQHLTRAELLKFVPDGSCLTWIDKDISFGVSNIGNDSLSWTLVASQKSPGWHADQFTMPKRRLELGLSMNSININGSVGNLAVPQGRTRSGSGGSAGEWKVPSDSGLSSARGSTTSSKPRDSATQPPAGRDSVSEAKPVVVQTALANPVLATTQPTPAANTSPTYLPPVAFVDSFGSDNLSGDEARDLALYLSATTLNMPNEALSIMACTTANLTAAHDNKDLYGENGFKSYTSPNFHPGRVILVGDAAHTVATAPHGSHGGSLALCDVVVLAKLVGFYLSPQGKASILATSGQVRADALSLDAIVLDHISKTFTDLRLGKDNQAMVDGHFEATWIKQEPGFWKNLVRMSVGNTWARSSWEATVDRGKATMGEEVVEWPRLA